MRFTLLSLLAFFLGLAAAADMQRRQETESNAIGVTGIASSIQVSTSGSGLPSSPASSTSMSGSSSTSGAGTAPISSQTDVVGTSTADQNMQASATSAGMAAPTGAIHIAQLVGVGAVMGMMV